jgi:hypothetical protein
MAEKKKPSKIKKIVKNLLKAATLGTIGYGAAKMFGGGKKKFGTAAGFLRSGAAGGPYGSMPFDPAQGNRSDWQKMARNYKDDIMRDGTGMTPDKTDRPWWKFKKGGRVTGIAKRGFGRALKKK